jgi:eukaryotic-like serine/threonine-protein kinase
MIKMNTNNVNSRRNLLQFSFVLGVTGILYGCGGDRNKNTPNTISGLGSASVRIEWPFSPLSRYLPQYAKSIVADLFPQDDPNTHYRLVANRPDTLPAQQTLTFNNLPAGKTYLLNIFAHIDKDGNGEKVATTSTQVQIQAGQTTRASLTLESTIQKIEISGQPLQLKVGESLTLTGNARDKNNNILLLPTNALTWSIVSGNTLGTLTSEGRLTAQSTGTMRVRLSETAIGLSAEADVSLVFPNNGLAISAWPKDQGDSRNTGRGQGRGAIGQKKWEYLTAVYYSPTIGNDGTIYITGYTGNIHAIDGLTGMKKWESLVDGPIHSSPLISSDGTIYFSSGFYSRNQRLNAIDLLTGGKKWEFIFPDDYQPYGIAIGPNGIIYVGTQYLNTDYGYLQAIDGRTGMKKWEFSTNGSVRPTPAIGADGTVYIGAANSNIYAIDGITGAKKWEYSVNSSVYYSSPVVGSNGTIYIGTSEIASDNGSLYALDETTGAKKWITSTGKPIHSIAIGYHGNLYVRGSFTTLYAFSEATGTQIWEFYLTGSGSNPVVDSDETVYIGTNINKLYAIDGNSGVKKWEFIADTGLQSAPAIGSDGTIYIGGITTNSIPGRLYAIR